MMQAHEQTFESILHELHETIGRLEQGGLPLQDAVEQFEQGMALATRCLSILDTAELRVTRVLDAAGSMLDEPAF